MSSFHSLRSRLVAAMVLPALIAVGVAYLLYSSVDRASEQAADRKAAQEVADRLAAQLNTSPGRLPDVATLEATLPDDQIAIAAGNRTVLSTATPAGPRQLELIVTAPFAGGTVTVRDYTTPGEAVPADVIVVAAAPVLLLVVSAVAATSYLSRALRRQIGNARRAADRVAAGDLSARMGADARGEFVALARAFDGMALRLETSDRNQRQFLGDLAHELATPLTAISGTGLALAEGSVTGDEARLAAATTLTRETRRLQELLADLRRLTRMDLTEPVSEERVALDAVCADVVDALLPVAAAAGVHLTLRTAPVTTVCDRRLVEMIIGNLVSNAIRYTPAGGSARLEVRRQHDEAVFTVRDTGIGIDPSHQQRIFDRFYRVDEARRRATGGSGLGLAIARRAAAALGGRIDVSSELGQGSTFRVVLPIRVASEPTAPVAAARR